jgi:hypothetical protein
MLLIQHSKINYTTTNGNEHKGEQQLASKNSFGEL